MSKPDPELHYLISRHDWIVWILFATLMAIGAAFSVIVYLHDA